MSHSNVESGHYKNVASFHALLKLCEAMGGQYNPSRADLSLLSLQNRAANADDLMERLSKMQASLSAAIHERSEAFAQLRKFSTRMMNALEQSNPGSTVHAGARHLVSKIHGKRIGKERPAADQAADAAQTVRISASQTGFDAQLDHFVHLVHLFEQEPAYAPNEPEMSLEGLHDLVKQFSQYNLHVAELNGQYQILLKERKQMLYGPVSGLLPISAAIKKYFIMILGTNSGLLKAAQALVFKQDRK